MNPIYVCFSLKSFTSTFTAFDEFEKDYQAVYKPLARFLYTHQSFCFSLAFTGPQLQFLKKKRNEFTVIIKELVERKQVEMLGGGFYAPILPLLFPVDRGGQIDLLSAEIRQTTGKRPRGITLFEDCWDSSLVNSLQTCGIEYTLLESSIIPPNKRKFLPIIMTDFGKSIDIYPYYENLVPESNQTAEDFVKNIVRQVEKVEKKDTYLQYEPERIVNICFSHEQFKELIEKGWFEELSNYLENNETRIITSTPYIYGKKVPSRIQYNVTAGINSSFTKWTDQTVQDVENKQNYPVTVYDFMSSYPQSHKLYNRIMYLSMLVNMYKNDKMRKKAAREKLWQAQNGTALLCATKSKDRQLAYKYLMEAEKILREDSNFKESVICFDYNGDGLGEYVCRMQNYFSYITLTGGAIQELEILKNTGNYADNFSRIKEYDGYSDDYERGLFVDHIFTKDDFDKYISAEPAGDGVFSRIRYSELKFSQNHHEVQLYAEAVFKPTKQKLYLKKKYIINSTGMIIQYILRNDSDKPFNAVFAVENNFAHTNFNPNNITYYNLEVIDNDEKLVIEPDKSTEMLNRKNKLSKVNNIRLTDSESGISFGLEPNENCNFCYYPMIFKRPDFVCNEIIPVHMTFLNTMFWNVEIEPGKETEKTINFTITSVKKVRSKQLNS
ncbi:MAG: DUF1926 domain-containing protein [Treponema sp.]|nr:DUF1926 domain-containing protein [Treponema sp.]